MTNQAMVPENTNKEPTVDPAASLYAKVNKDVDHKGARPKPAPKPKPARKPEPEPEPEKIAEYDSGKYKVSPQANHVSKTENSTSRF